MNTYSTHIIHRVNVDINTNSMQQAEDINKNMNVFLHQKILPAIEELIAKKYSNLSVRLDALNLELNMRNWQQFSAADLEVQLDKALEVALKEQGKNLPNDNSSQENSGDITSKPWAALIHFLNTGQKLWFVGEASSMQDWVTLCLEQLQKKQPSGTELILFLQTLFQNKQARLRLLKQVPQDFITALMQNYLDTQIATLWKNYSDEVHESVGRSKELLLQEFLLQLVITQQLKKQVSKEFLRNEIIKLWNLVFFANTTKRSKHRSNDKIIASRLIDYFKKLSDILTGNEVLKQVVVELFSEDVFGGLKGQRLESLHSETQSSDIRQNEESLETTHVPEALFSNAGLILVHPYIPMFLEHIGVFKKGDKAIESKHYDLATHALHFLATGHKNAYEADMQFIKWILNIPGEVITDRFFQVDNHVKTETSKLLSSVLENWTALKTSSIDTLRAMFFDRTAKMTDDENAYRLHFERKAQDVLLNQLPWGYSFVKLPWKQKLIQVIW